MIRLINDSGVLGEKIESLDNVTFDQMIEAIHKIQDNLGVTGTTAAEAGTTISGSWSSVQALFENILTKVGSKLAPTVMGFYSSCQGGQKLLIGMRLQRLSVMPCNGYLTGFKKLILQRSLKKEWTVLKTSLKN